MLTSTDLATRPGFAVAAVTCRDDHTGWSRRELSGAHRLVLVRRGRFRRRSRHGVADVDPTFAYLSALDEEAQYAHPAGGDVCTSVSLTPTLWRALAGETPHRRTSTVYVDAQIDLAHRRLLNSARAREIDYAVVEDLLALLGRAVLQVASQPTPAGAAPARADRALVAEARAAVADDHPAAIGLLPLAESLAVSPYRLSRAFSREVGISLTRYRNRVRVGKALDRLEAGEPSLAVLATDLGFADQAHLTRTIRDQLGHTPTALRRLLRP